MSRLRKVLVAALAIGLSASAWAVEGEPQDSTATTASHPASLGRAQVAVGVLDIANGSTLGLGVEGRHLPTEMNHYSVLRNPGEITDITSGNLYFELGDRRSLIGGDGASLSNTQQPRQWGGLTWGQEKWGSLGLFVARPYAGSAQLAGTDPNGRISNSATLPAATDPNQAHLGAVGASFVPRPGAAAPAGGFVALTPDGKADIVYGYGRNKWSAGVRFSAASNRQTPSNETFKTTEPAAGAGFSYVERRRSSDFGFGLGFTLRDIVERIPRVELSAQLDFPRVSNFVQNVSSGVGGVEQETVSDQLKSKNQASFGGAVKTTVKVNDNVNWILFGSYGRQNQDTDRTVSRSTGITQVIGFTDTYDFARHAWNLEWSVNAKLSDKTMLVVSNGLNIVRTVQRNTRNVSKNDAAGVGTLAGIGAGADPGLPAAGNTGIQEDDSSTVNTLSLPIWIGLSHKVADPVTLRLGVMKRAFERVKTTIVDQSFTNASPGTLKTTTNNETTVSDVPTPAIVNVGLGVAVTENLGFDAVVQKDVFFHPGAVANGNEQLFSLVSARYRF